MESPFHFRAVVFGMLAAVTVGAVAGAARAGDSPQAPGVAGMRVYRDPVTGAVGTPPPDLLIPAEPATRRATPQVESPGTSTAGGWKLDMSAAPMHAIVATPDPEGKPKTQCVPAAPGGKE